MLGPRRRGRNGGRVPFRSRLRAIQWRPHSSTESSAAHRVMVARNRTIRRASRRDSINRPAGFNRQAGGASGWDLLNDPFGKRAGCDPRPAAGSFDESVMTNQRRDCTRCEDWLAQNLARMSLVRTIVRYCTRVVLNRHESRRLVRRIVRFLAKNNDPYTHIGRGSRCPC